MEMIDIKNKKLRDDEFYKIRKEVLATWETGKEVDLDEAIAYHKSLPEHKIFSNKLNKAKKIQVTMPFDTKYFHEGETVNLYRNGSRWDVCGWYVRFTPQLMNQLLDYGVVEVIE